MVLTRETIQGRKLILRGNTVNSFRNQVHFRGSLINMSIFVPFPTGFTPVYVGQVANNLTGEHTAIMIKPLLHQEDENEECSWLKAFFSDFRRRLVNLLGFEFRAFSARK